MKARLIAALFALALVFTPSLASAQGDAWLHFIQGNVAGTPFQGLNPNSPATYEGAFVGPYFGQIGTNSGSGFVSSTDIFMYCVDYIGQLSAGDVWEVYITPLIGGDFSRTKVGVADQYLQAAYGAYQFRYPETASSHEDGIIQTAIWQIMGYNPAVAAGDQPSIDNWKAFIGEEYSKAEWDAFYQTLAVATAVDRYGNFQEVLIPWDPGTPQETVPEPATMTMIATGLVGMAAARRRKQQSL